MNRKFVELLGFRKFIDSQESPQQVLALIYRVRDAVRPRRPGALQIADAEHERVEVRHGRQASRVRGRVLPVRVERHGRHVAVGVRALEAGAPRHRRQRLHRRGEGQPRRLNEERLDRRPQDSAARRTAKPPRRARARHRCGLPSPPMRSFIPSPRNTPCCCRLH